MKFYVYAWGNNPIRKKYKGKRCRILAYGAKNSVLLEFLNGEQIVTSRFAVRKPTDVERRAIEEKDNKEKTVNTFFKEAV